MGKQNKHNNGETKLRERILRKQQILTKHKKDKHRTHTYREKNNKKTEAIEKLSLRNRSYGKDKVGLTKEKKNQVEETEGMAKKTENKRLGRKSKKQAKKRITEKLSHTKTMKK